MKPTLSIEQLKRLKAIMQAMLSEANNANWQELSRLDSERRVLINYKANTVEKHSFLADSASKIMYAGAQGSDISSSTSAARLASSQKSRPAYNPENDKPRMLSASDLEYQVLSKEIVALDRQISDTVQQARQVLLEQTRGLKAQVTAKKRYEQTSTIKASSYS